MHELSHCATVACAVAADVAFAYVADPERLGSWALGCLDARPVAPDTVAGRSLFDGSESFVRVLGRPQELTVDYATSADGQDFRPRISARVVPGADLGRPAGTCLVTLLAWRTAEMSDERWGRLVASHEVEIRLLQARIDGLAGAG